MKWANKLPFASNPEKYAKAFLFLLIAVQGLCIFLYNLTQTNAFLFPDNALAIGHGIEIWKNGIFLDGFNYYSTLEIDNAAFFAIPLYYLTGHLGLSLGFVHLLLYVLCVYLVYSIFKNSGYHTEFGLLAAFFLFTPYVISGLDWGNMLFITVGQYEFRIIVMLSLVNLMLIALNKTKTNKEVLPLLIVHALFCFWTTLSCGNYLILMILFPMVLFFGYINCITEKLNINKHVVIVLVITLVSCVIPLLIRNSAIGDTSRGSLPLLTADTFSANLLNCITGFFMLFGGLTQEPDIPIFTMNAILRITKFAFISTCLVLVYLKLKKATSKDYLHKMLAFVALVNLAVMILAFTRYGALIFEHRYHLAWGVLLVVTATASFDAIPYPRLKNVIMAGLVCMAILINLDGYKAIIARVPTESNFSNTIIEIADDQQVDTIYVYNLPEEASRIRVLDYNKKCMSITYVVDYVYSSTEDYYEDYYTRYDYDCPNIFVCHPDLLFTIPEEILEHYTLIDTIDGYNFYVSYENPWL